MKHQCLNMCECGHRCDEHQSVPDKHDANGCNRCDCNDFRTVELETILEGPQKFEGQPAYVEYYWTMFLNGLADEDDGRLLGFQVTKKDKALFPALKRRKMVWLEELDNGFVVER